MYIQHLLRVGDNLELVVGACCLVFAENFPVLVVSLAYHVCWFEMSSNDGKKTRSFRSLSFRSSKNKKKKSSSDTVDGSTAPQHYRHSVSEFTNNNNFTSKSTPVCTVIATHSFTAILPCDLSFNQGDRIDVLTRTNTCFDWWEGRMNGRIGIFPANYVKVLD
ncbi:SH3 domain-containing YSC84-like protein 1 isoform X2 [Acanthaster planci]|uniref:SH3 domain-containing YSC84-like protein 1 n=1 Tax=Acanthaster planci TaxID=133434 RepID=A0A8B7YSX0_ACAPL|nr:SH3 domain-containing YSC84-like protein 1 isoform X2 [Acanthaster planci]